MVIYIKIESRRCNKWLLFGDQAQLGLQRLRKVLAKCLTVKLLEIGVFGSLIGL